MELGMRNSKAKLGSIFVLLMMFPYAVLAQSGLSDDDPVRAEPGTNTAHKTDRGPQFINNVRIGMVGRHYAPLEEGQTVEFIPGDLPPGCSWDEG